MPFCSRCGNALPGESRFCNHCGASLGPPAFPVVVQKPREKSFLKSVFIFFAVLIGVSMVISFISAVGTESTSKSSAPKTPEQLAKEEQERQKKEKQEADFQRAVLAARQLKSAMRNPDSFKLSEALIMENGSVCFTYRAQNGFGGMNLGNAVVTARGDFRSDESSGFTRLWNKECANKVGYDKTRVVNTALNW